MAVDITSEDGGARLAGLEVAVTGRMASMSRATARDRIAAAGGRYVTRPTATTALLVVGKDRHTTASLARARAMQESGHPIRIVQEPEFLALLSTSDDAELDRLYTTDQVARMLDVPAATVRGWIRQDLIRPTRVVHRLCFFDFPRVAMARTLCRLTRTGVTLAKIRRSLEQLGHWLPDSDQALSQLEALEQGAVVVRLADGRLAEPGGQLRLDFDGAAEVAATPMPRLSTTTDPEDWFLRGVRAEAEGSLEEAEAAYRNALATASHPEPEIYFNLGNCLYSAGRTQEAVEAFRRAVDGDQDYVEAWNNLANALGETGDPDGAIAAYRRAIALAPFYADAHYNLADTLHGQGDRAGARRHWRAYLSYDPHSPGAEEVRARLRN